MLELTANTEAGARLVLLAETLAHELARRAPEHDRAASFPHASIAALKDAGYFTAPIPAELGGLGVTSTHDVVVASSRLARGDASVAIGVNMHFAVLLNMVMCVEIFGLMRRSALLCTSLLGPFGGADKVLLAQLSLLGTFWLGEETLFFRRCHARQFSSANSGAYRAEWFSGRRDSIFAQQVKLLLAYCKALYTTRLTARQRCICLQAIVRRAISRGRHLRRLIEPLVGNP